MEWIKKIIESHTNDEGVVDLDKAVAEINKAFPTHAIPKDQYNNIAEQLKEARQTMADLEKELDASKKENPKIEELYNKAKAAQEVAEAELKDLQVQVAFDNAVRDKVIDVDFARFKYGEIELDKDGNVKGLDKWLEDFGKNHPTQIAQVADGNEGEAESNKPKIELFGAKPNDPSTKANPQTMSLGAQMAEKYKQENAHLYGTQQQP